MNKGNPLPTWEYRRNYRREQIPLHYSGLGHFVITNLLAILVIVFCLCQLKAVQAWEILSIPVFLFLANMVEYWGHRGPMHHKVPLLSAVFKRHALEHHRFFTYKVPFIEQRKDMKIVLFPPILILFFLGLMAMPLGQFFYHLLTPNIGFLFGACALFHFLCYEWLHLYYHLPSGPLVRLLDRLSFFRFLKHHHLLHHDTKRSVNFNLTLPLMDMMLGTLYRYRSTPSFPTSPLKS